MARRVVLITEIIAPYRIPEFNALAERPDIDLHVIFLAETDATQRDWLVYKNEIRFQYEVLPAYRRRVRGRNFLFNWGMSKALSRLAPNTIICGGYNYLAAWRAKSWARSAKVPFFLWSESNASDLRSGNWIAESLKKSFIRACWGFIVPGRSSREYLAGYGVSHGAIFFAPNAVDNEFFVAGSAQARADGSKRLALGLPSRYFLFVGRLVQEKGIFDLLEAYRLLPPDLRAKIGLVFVGNGAGKSELVSRAANISPGTIKVAGFAQRDELAVYYGLAEGFVFPTHSDPWGLVVNEAMACALPILATDVAGCVADLVKDGQNGFVTGVGNVAALTNAMSRLAGDGSLRDQMGKSSEEIIRAFSPAAWAGGIVQAVQTASREADAH